MGAMMHQGEAILIVTSLLMTRMLVAFSVWPIFMGQTVPVMVRMALAVALSSLMLPAALHDPAMLSISTPQIVFVLLKEAGIGLVLGFLSGIGFWALYTAGTIIEFQAGMSMATVVDPTTGQDDSMVGGLMMQMFTMLFLVTGGLLSMIGTLYESYQVWPIPSMALSMGNASLVEVGLRALSEMLGLALKVAAPFLLLMLMVEIGLGLLSRFAPQLNAFFLAMPLKALILSLLMLLYGAGMSESLRALPIADFPGMLNALRGVWHE